MSLVLQLQINVLEFDRSVTLRVCCYVCGKLFSKYFVCYVNTVLFTYEIIR